MFITFADDTKLGRTAVKGEGKNTRWSWEAGDTDKSKIPKAARKNLLGKYRMKITYPHSSPAAHKGWASTSDVKWLMHLRPEDLNPFLSLNSSKISARVLCLVWGSWLQVKHGLPGESPEERKRTSTNLGNTDTVTINRRLRWNLGDVKTGFKNKKVATQQKKKWSVFCAHLDTWEVIG